MIRTCHIFAAALVVLGATGVSFGQALTVNQPKRGDDESANATAGIAIGDSTVVSLHVPAGLNGTGELVDGDEIVLTNIEVLDSTGASVGNPGGPGFPINTGVTYDDILGSDVDVVLSDFDFGPPSLPVGLSAGDVIQITVSSVDPMMVNPDGTGITAAFDAADETIDETLALDATPPVLQDFLITATKAFARFDKPIDSDGDAVGPPNENVNDTDAANVTELDFQRSVTAGFVGGEPSPTNMLLGVGFSGSSDNVLELSLGMGDLVAGDFIRLNVDDPAGLSLFDIVGNQGGATEVLVANLPGLDAVSAELVTTIAAGAIELEALRVTFNDEIADPGDAGDYTFRLNGMASTFILANPTIDPNDNTSVLLDIAAPGGDGVESDARTTSSGGDATGAFTLRVLGDGMGADITDIFGQSITSPDDVSVDDAIEPSLASTGFGDEFLSDGNQDTAFMVFDEPMTLPPTTTGFTLTLQDAVVVNPFDLIDSLGNLVGALTAIDTMTPANNEIPIAGTTLASIDLDSDGTITARETNNAIAFEFDPLTFDWDHDGSVGPGADADEPIPGTGDADVVLVDYDLIADEIDDANANVFNNGGGGNPSTLTSDDYAKPIIAVALLLDGDNTDPDPASVISDNDQSLIELFIGGMPADSDLGRELESRRVVVAFSEDLAALTNAILEEQISIGGEPLPAATDDMGSFGFASANMLTLRNAGGNPDFEADPAPTSLIFNTFSDVVDASPQANETDDSSGIADGRAPYLRLQATLDPVEPPVHGAFLIDTNDDGFADQINLQMTQPIDAATLDTTDFTPAFGTITGIALDAISNSVIVLTLTDGVISASNPLSITYNGSTDATLIASDSGAGGTGFGVSAIDAVFDASPFPEASPTDNVAIMDIIGTATQGGNPVPAGTRIVAMVATPVVTSITADHNNNTFTTSDDSSITAFTNWLLGIAGADFVYLGRDAENRQFYDNDKDLGDPANGATLEDVIQLDINARLITAISFAGIGEDRRIDRVRNGSVEICWDVYRSMDGSTAALHSSGYDFGGAPILSQTIVRGTGGAFELHVGAPVAAFNQRANLNAIGNPIILVCELPDGTRFPLSSLLTSVNGAPVLFNPNNRTQNSDGTATGATVFDFDLDRTGAVSAHPGWNLLGFDRNSGYAIASSNRPVLPAGLNSGDVIIGTTLAFARPLDQFVYFIDMNADGDWTASEDPGFANVIVDADCFDNFAFTMTNFGVQAGSGISNFVGGYGLGLFVNGASTYGVFQFGAQRTGTDFFSTSFAFPNTTTTLGWGLFAAPSAFASPGAINAANPEFDFMIQFRNDGDGFLVATADLDNPGGTSNANDVDDVDDGEASFYHIQK